MLQRSSKPLSSPTYFFYMIMNDCPNVHLLINAHITTWLQLAGCTDLVFITDLNDPRSLKKIVLETSQDLDVTLHLHKSPEINEGKHFHFKKMYAIRNASEKCAKNDSKKHFFKMYTDMHALGQTY